MGQLGLGVGPRLGLDLALRLEQELGVEFLIGIGGNSAGARAGAGTKARMGVMPGLSLVLWLGIGQSWP